MLLSMLLACFGKVPDYLVDPMQFPHAQCPTAEHLMAVGFDPESPASAQRNARQRVAERVSSTISTQQSTSKTFSNLNGVESTERRLDEASQVVSTFDFYNLINDVGAPHRSKDGYRSLACMSLAEWEQEVMQTTQEQRSRLNQQAQSLSKTNDVFAFGLQQHQFYQGLSEMTPIMQTLRAVLNRPSMLEMDVSGQVSMVERKSEKMRQQNPIFIMDNVVPVGVQARVSQHLQAGGITVTKGSCTGVNGIAMQLALQTSQSKGPMGGEVSQKTVTATLQSCGSGEVKTYTIVEAQGYHSSNPALAEKKAIAGLENFDLPDELIWFLPMHQ